MPTEVETLMLAAEAAEAAARATLITPEQERVVIDAAEALAGAAGTLADPLLDEQRMAMLVVSRVRLGDFDGAAEPLEALAASPRSSKAVWAAEYRDRIAFLRTWPDFVPWTPHGPPR